MTNGFRAAKTWRGVPKWSDGLQYVTYKIPGMMTRTEKFFYAMQQAARARANRRWKIALHWIDTARDYQDYGRVLRAC